MKARIDKENDCVYNNKSRQILWRREKWIYLLHQGMINLIIEFVL